MCNLTSVVHQCSIACSCCMPHIHVMMSGMQTPACTASAGCMPEFWHHAAVVLCQMALHCHAGCFKVIAAALVSWPDSFRAMLALSA
jgi:hypothetical protein